MADDVVRDPPGAIWKRLDVIARRITDHYTAGPDEDIQLAGAISELRRELRACADDLAPPRLDFQTSVNAALRHRGCDFRIDIDTDPTGQAICVPVPEVHSPFQSAEALAPPAPGWQLLATDLFNLVMADFEWVRAQGGRHSVCPLCHAVCERDGGPGHQDDCPRFEFARRFDLAMGQPLPPPPRADDLVTAPSPHKAEATKTDTRGQTMEIPEGRRTASQHEVITALMQSRRVTDEARRCVDRLRDFAREQGMHHFQRDPLVMGIHRALDAFDTSAAALDAAPEERHEETKSDTPEKAADQRDVQNDAAPRAAEARRADEGRGGSMGTVLVAGERMERPIYAFVLACDHLLADEQAKPNPDNALIAVLCDAVRLTRELAALAKEPLRAEALAPSPAGHNGAHVFAVNEKPLLAPVLLRAAAVARSAPGGEK